MRVGSWEYGKGIVKSYMWSNEWWCGVGCGLKSVEWGGVKNEECGVGCGVKKVEGDVV